MPRLLIVIIMVMLLINKAFAVDVDSNEEIPGNTIIPLHDTKIRMINQIIRVEVDNVTGYTEVKALYMMENTESASFNLEIGFPFSESSEPPFKRRVGGKVGEVDRKFIVRVDGKDVSFAKDKISDQIKLRIGILYDYLYRWQVHFRPKEIKKIECNYFIEWGFDTHLTLDRRLRYILDNGALWRDTIKQTDIFIKLSNSSSELLKENKIKLFVRPAGYKIIDNQIIEWNYVSGR